MDEKQFYSEKNFNNDIEVLINWMVRSDWKNHSFTGIYAVPRGGIPIGAALSQKLSLPLVSKKDISDSTLIVDDIIDSGETRKKFESNFFVSLHNKNYGDPMTFSVHEQNKNWIVYFWEENEISSAEDSVTRQLQFIGEDIEREGLLETPKRVVKSWNYLFSGYHRKVKDELTVFDAEGCDEIVLLDNIELYSMCEHHLLPFYGKAHVAYIPNEKIVGISKLARIVDIFSRRAQNQERIGQQITEALMDHLKPKAVACIIEAKHLCMMARGVEKQNSVMKTSSMRGVFREKPEARAELMSLINR